MDVIITFSVAFFFSFIGTIPPGTINLTIVQMGLDHKVEPAWRFAVASSIVEYLYGWIAVEFESVITSSPHVTANFELISAVVMLVLGAISLYSAKKPSRLVKRFDESGFRKGIILGVLNPLALPFWVAMTAYIKSQSWIRLSDKVELHAYLFGVALGGLALLMIFFYLAKSVVRYFEGNTILKQIPGFTLFALGSYALVKYLLT